MAAVATRFADLPLDDLFPGIALETKVRLAELGDHLDAARQSGDPARWRWYPELSAVPTPSAGEPAILGTTLSLPKGPDDLLELALDVWQGVSVSVTASVDVGCRCPTNHNMHTVKEVEWPIEATSALPEAFAGAVDVILRWLTGPPDPAVWREQAGLPNPA